MGKRKRGKNRSKDAGSENQQQSEPPAPTDHSKEHEVSPAHRDTTEDKRDPENRFRPPATWADWTIVAFTGVLTAVTLVQGCFMRTQIRQTQETIDQARMDRRAWISASTPKVNDLVVGQPVKCTIVLTNSGATPGNVVYANLKILPLPTKVASHEIEFKNVNDDRDKYKIAPVIYSLSTGAQLITNEANTYELTAPDLAGIEKGDIQLIVFCKCYYRDVFDSEKIRATFLSCYYDPTDEGLYIHQSGSYMD